MATTLCRYPTCPGLHFEQNRVARRFSHFHWLGSAVHDEVVCYCDFEGLGFPCYELTAQHQDRWRKAYRARARYLRRIRAGNLKCVPMGAR